MPKTLPALQDKVVMAANRAPTLLEVTSQPHSEARHFPD